MNINAELSILKTARRGESNALRRGKSKIHRRYCPQICGSKLHGTAAKVVARMKNHDWHRNKDLINRRRIGYIPYTRRNDPHFEPKPMRVSARSESCESLTALSMALAAHCDYNPDSEFPFEIMVPFEQIAAAMGQLHIYENGRKAYDAPLKALSVLEQLDYVVIARGKDADSGQNKALRIWITDRFFTSRGILVEEIRQWLTQFKAWASKKGLVESLRKKYERHLLRLERLGLDIKNRRSLRNRLKQIKRWVISPDLAEKKRIKVAMLKDELADLVKKNPKRTDSLPNHVDTDSRSMKEAKAKPQKTWYRAFVIWSTSANVMPYQVSKLEQTLSKEYPGLRYRDPEAYYRLFLHRAGQY